MLQIDEKLANQQCLFQEADYLMPKGRLKHGESAQKCAVREFAEETGYSPEDVSLVPWPPFEERFTGTDGKAYRNVFYLAALQPDATIRTVLGSDPHQSKEVRNVGWFTLPECNMLIRPYHQEKKDILQDVYKRVLPSAYVKQLNLKRLGLQIRSPRKASKSIALPQRWHGRWSPHRRRIVSDRAYESTSKERHVIAHRVVHVGSPLGLGIAG
jgi:8-oxo-dGTP pyrophosphatase MutT (NUDIX family)